MAAFNKNGLLLFLAVSSPSVSVVSQLYTDDSSALGQSVDGPDQRLDQDDVRERSSGAGGSRGLLSYAEWAGLGDTA